MTARLLVVMGSGETAPTMVKVHRSVVAAVGSPSPGSPSPGLLLDTPFGFQANADELAARAVAYFAQSVGAPLDVACARTADDLAGRSGEAVAARLAAAPFVFSGPGSPTYALGLWRGSLVPGLLADKLHGGGAVVFSSAAALTLGAFTVPVYEIYKVGAAPRWEAGLDVLRAVDPRLHVAVVPHFDNAEGGTHDTRFCYLGAARLARLQADLPEGAWVLGVDEHTALVADLDAARVEVAGIGGVTVRVGDRAEVVPSGSSLDFDELAALAARLCRQVQAPSASLAGAAPAGFAPAGAAPAGAAPAGTTPAGAAGGAARGGRPPSGRGIVTGTGSETSRSAVAAGPVAGGDVAVVAISPLLRATRRHQAAFARARGSGDATSMVEAVLGLEEELWAWRTDPTQTDEQDRVRAVLRAMVAQLGEVAEVGTRDPADAVAPFVALALDLRAGARVDRRFADADAIRDRLMALGVEVRDTPEGTGWRYRQPPPTAG